jgi:O-antigen/teichoic acid export membrane protein
LASQTKKITLDTGALFFGKVMGLLLGMVRLNYLATYLGVASFGILNFALYFCSLFQVLFDLGISQFLTRDLARNLSRSNEFVGKAILLKIIVVSVASLVVGSIGIVSHFDRVTNWTILLTTIVFAINGISMVFLSAFQAHRKMTIISISNILNDLLLSAAIILIIREIPSVITVLVLSIFVALVNLAILFIVYRHTVGLPQFRIDIPLWREFVRESTPIAVSTLGISTYTYFGSTVLKYTRGDVEVGIFSAGYKLISVLTLIPVTFSQVVYPIFSDFAANAPHKLNKALQDSLRVMAQISIPLAIGVFILAPQIISLLYPVQFAEAISVLRIVICGDALVYLAWIVFALLLALNYQKICMWISVSVAFISLIMNLFIVPRFGYVGVASNLFLTDIILFISYFYHARKMGFSIDRLSNYLKIFLSAGFMGIVLFLLKDWYLIPNIFVGSGIYFALLYVMKCFGDQEKELFVKVFRG